MPPIDRIRKSTQTKSENISPGYITIKDHKIMKEGSLPDTRFMVSGVQGMGLSLNNMASDVMEAAADKLSPDLIEVKSSEHLMFKFNSYNKKLEENILTAKTPDQIEDLMSKRILLGTDVKA